MPNGFSSVNANDQNNSPNSSQISGDGSVGLPGNHEPSLISRTQKQHITQQVSLRKFPIMLQLQELFSFDQNQIGFAGDHDDQNDKRNPIYWARRSAFRLCAIRSRPGST